MVDKSSKLMDKFVTSSGGGGGGCGGPGSGSASAAGNATSSSSASATAAGFGAGGIGGGSNMTTSNGQKPVPMKLFAAWEVDRTPPNCIPRWVREWERDVYTMHMHTYICELRISVWESECPRQCTIFKFVCTVTIIFSFPLRLQIQPYSYFRSICALCCRTLLLCFFLFLANTTNIIQQHGIVNCYFFLLILCCRCCNYYCFYYCYFWLAFNLVYSTSPLSWTWHFGLIFCR